MTTSATQRQQYTLFRPCIDLHDGKVKQIVGGTLTTSSSTLKTNFVADQPPAYFAELYRKHRLEGGHVIMLGKGNAEAAKEALRAWPGECRFCMSVQKERLGSLLRREGAQAGCKSEAESMMATHWNG